MRKQYLDQDQEWFRAIIHSIHDGVLVIDREEIVRLINPEYTRITGVRPEVIMGKPLRSVRPGAQLVETLRDGKARVGIYRKEGDTEYVVDMAPIVIEGEIVGAVSICKGLTEVHKLSLELEKNKQKLQQLEKTMGSLYRARYTFDHIVGARGGLSELVRIAKKAADSQLPVLITGESGTGKELFAQSIHNESRRAHRPFIPVNCAAIPAALLESELFGYEEGSFTHAKKGGKTGLFEIANGGTIFLDEIGELPYELQAKLLRVLQEGSIRKVGEVREREIDVRVIAATNRDLGQLVEKRLFREDLYYRLHVLSIHIPSLRDRKEDIPGLVASFLAAEGGQPRMSVHEEVFQLLLRYEWPGNIRELKNTMDYAMCMAEGREIQVHNLPAYLQQLPRNFADLAAADPGVTLREVVENAERQWISATLRQFGEDVEERKRAANKLGVSLATLYNKMRKYNLNPSDDSKSLE
ncbi:sigma 54-interacting transcriptional regulator [Brevibacillus brevis]|uniref:HTH-type transcriptional regulatory protein TyrR n=1 Tax=Brevibacillus brevis TaxID=1393 RepID=A0ABY9T2R6_BREBE|nr:sigma 54-interacting transcriptional regulator [Brevibacillus brevis]WNC14306.1 sigma 54-interacting transcriptional regulator [Brevibacillus brevis]